MGIEKSVAVTDGDGYNFCGNGWGWLDFPLPCRSLERKSVIYTVSHKTRDYIFDDKLR